VQPGQSLLAIVPLNQLWIDANFKETELAGMRIGQPAIATSDLYGNRVTYEGRVVGLGAGTGGVFALLPPQNATGNWIKVVQRLPVRIALSSSQLKKHPLRLGLSMNVAVDTRNRNGPVLASAPVKWPAYSTSVYGAASRGISAVIARVVSENEGPKIDPVLRANGSRR
jgi:membrane fusion protein (multidrug efflux system)